MSAKPLAPDASDGLFVDQIGKSFRDRVVVNHVSLRLRRGEVAGLLGPNGAGKTTCFYMITGLVAADYGRIVLDGEDITAQPMYQRARMGLGYLPQEASIFRGMTVAQNVMAVVELRERNPSAARATVERLLEELHIGHLKNSPAQTVRGDNAVYMADSDTITITGGVIVTQGKSVARGDSMTVQVKSGHVQLKSSAKGRGNPGRVRGVFYPDQGQPAVAAKP